MRPIEQAKQVYLQKRSKRCFENDLCAHLQHGYVYSGGDFFAMGRPVLLRMDEHGAPFPEDVKRLEIIPWVDQEQVANCWFIWMGAGRWQGRRLEKLMPYPLPYLAWHRRAGKLEILDLEKIRRRTHGIR